MNREELDSFSNLISMPSDVMARRLKVEWLDQKMDALKCTSKNFAQREYVESFQEVFDALVPQLEQAGCKGVYLISCYKIFNEGANSGFIHIVVTGIFD